MDDVFENEIKMTQLVDRGTCVDMVLNVHHILVQTVSQFLTFFLKKKKEEMDRIS